MAEGAWFLTIPKWRWHSLTIQLNSLTQCCEKCSQLYQTSQRTVIKYYGTRLLSYKVIWGASIKASQQRCSIRGNLSACLGNHTPLENPITTMRCMTVQHNPYTLETALARAAWVMQSAWLSFGMQYYSESHQYY